MSKTINQLKADYQSKLRDKTAPGSISRMDDADMRDDTAIEIRDRGIITLASTAALGIQSNQNTKLVLISGVGIFHALQTATPANDETTFASADSGWLWERIVDLSDGKVKWFKVGVTPGSPIDGTTIWNHAAFIGRTPQFFLGSLPVPNLDPGDGSPWVDKDEEEEDQMNFHNYTFSNGSVIGFIV